MKEIRVRSEDAEDVLAVCATNGLACDALPDKGDAVVLIMSRPVINAVRALRGKRLDRLEKPVKPAKALKRTRRRKRKVDVEAGD